MFGQVVLALSLVLIGCGYKVFEPPAPILCSSPGGPPMISPRIRLRDGRHLAYRESGVSKEEAYHKIIVIHGFNECKDRRYPVSQELVEELKLYFVFYDRAGYGESDPYPKRSVKSEAYDIQELADALQLGSKFYVLGYSLGGYPAWSCLRYIPQRLAGVAFVAPFVHYWWPSFPSDVSSKLLQKLPATSDQWTFRVARYAPWLFYRWMTQKWFPTLSFLSGNTSLFSQNDLEILPKLSKFPQEKICPQGVYESLHRDIMAGFANWEFSPLTLENPFPENESSVHIWQGYGDKIVPYEVNRFIGEKLEWIKYHEVPDGGHLFIFEQSMFESIIKSLVLG